MKGDPDRPNILPESIRNGHLSKRPQNYMVYKLICSAQEQALRTNYMRFHTDHTAESPLCRMRGSKGETVAHVVSERGKLAHTEYKGRHDNLAWYSHWQLCGKCGLERVTGMNRSLWEWLRVKTPTYYGISQSSGTGKSRQEDQTLSY